MQRLMNRVLVALAVGLVGGIALVAPASTPAVAQTSDNTQADECPADFNDIETSDSVVRVIKVSGLIDPVVKNHLMGQLGEVPDNMVGVVLWMNSSDSVLNEADFNELAAAISDFGPTVAVWVGQPGATVSGGAAELAGLADMIGVSPGSTLGSTGPARSPQARTSSLYGDASERLETASIGANEAIRLDISVGPTQNTATIGPFLTYIPGYETYVCIPQATADGDLVGGSDGQTADIRTVSLTSVEFSNLPVVDGFFHTTGSPEVAYLFFAIGLGLLVFELFTAGVGIAGALGATFAVLGSYGMAVLPTRWWAIGLLVLAFVAMAVDIQTNVPRLYTIVGLAMFTIGTFTVYDGVAMSWITILVGLVGAGLYAYTGMPSMVRTRFSTPTIGRKWMIGKMATALTDVAPEGTIEIENAKWRAIANRATPIKAGDPVRVVGLDRLLLEVEPEHGGAKDYRDRS